MKDGANTNLKNLSSAAIRIARERKGVAEGVAPRLFRDGGFVNTLILSPPGGGKTTLLRDLVRCLSEGGPDCPPQRISLIVAGELRGDVAQGFQLLRLHLRLQRQLPRRQQHRQRPPRPETQLLRRGLLLTREGQSASASSSCRSPRAFRSSSSLFFIKSLLSLIISL
mgnify:CR=1 FL=1